MAGPALTPGTGQDAAALLREAAGEQPEDGGWTPLPAEPLRGRNQPVRLFGRTPR